MSTLYIVATPIGNLEDMTFRALRILKEAVLIAAEDTRTTRVLLNHYEIQTPMTSYHEHNKLKKLDTIFNALSQGDVALVSDAGTPGISDPGYELIQEAIRNEIPIVPVPGANAVIPALVASGLPTDGFVYVGFLPKRPKTQRELFEDLRDEPRTLVLYESPYRLTDTLKLILDILGNRQVCVAREMTKMFEEFYRGSAQDALDNFSKENPRGEVTLVIAGGKETDAVWSEVEVEEALREQLDAGDSLSRAAKIVAKASGWKKRDVYSVGVELS